MEPESTTTDEALSLEDDRGSSKAAKKAGKKSHGPSNYKYTPLAALDGKGKYHIYGVILDLRFPEVSRRGEGDVFLTLTLIDPSIAYPHAPPFTVALFWPTTEDVPREYATLRPGQIVRFHRLWVGESNSQGQVGARFRKSAKMLSFPPDEEAPLDVDAAEYTWLPSDVATVRLLQYWARHCLFPAFGAGPFRAGEDYLRLHELAEVREPVTADLIVRAVELRGGGLLRFRDASPAIPGRPEVIGEMALPPGVPVAPFMDGSGEADRPPAILKLAHVKYVPPQGPSQGSGVGPVRVTFVQGATSLFLLGPFHPALHQPLAIATPRRPPRPPASAG
ncbi:hypothetical protein PAPYR_5027 [Paratrimastix pyriformis]|uniref:Telomeric single stranded DNA binding POT1/Cdc13 domain-containing protein n=1 Tax=Paratrimastix pyriformis TaxID=342808 RepID=A0ABQ8UID0_9EUKA|nr:hypothetical protein PAPYR_5027 [Paratrimastix pyriformis]